ncbi:MAG: Secretion system C-terminal sorting domain [Bacteroidota bacterium]|jgi:hypothetical protein
MKKNLSRILMTLTLVSIIGGQLLSQAQSRLWTLPPHYVKFNPNLSSQVSLPAPGSGLDYAGQGAAYSHNAAHSSNGDLLFFVVDGVIYDKNGSYILELAGGQTFLAEGATECLIFPVPGQCNQWMVLAADVDDNFIGTAAMLTWVVIEFDNQQQFSTYYGNQPISTNVLPSDQYWNTMDMAISEELSNGTRMLYVHAHSGVRKFIINSNASSTGPIFQNVVSYIPAELLNNSTRSEMELTKCNTCSGGVSYRLAYPWIESNCCYKIRVCDLDANGDLISSIDIPLSYPSQIPKGLEFSPSGRYLYMTHTGANPIQYLDLNTSIITTLNPGVVSDFTDYSITQIERSFNSSDALFFASSGGFISALLFPDNPSITNWVINYNNNNISVPVLHSSLNQFGNQSLRQLPDQRDGEDYMLHFNQSLQCCVSNTNFTIDYYAAGTSLPITPSSFNFSAVNQTWTPTNNPFGGTASNPVGTVTIRNELKVPAGYTIIISGMTFKFAPRTTSPNQLPGARVVIEKGTSALRGAKLTLNNSTFTSYDNCGVGMWEGIEVHGDKNQTQGTWANSRQGWLSVQNNSFIENAYFGAITGKSTASYPNQTIDPNSSGGIIIAANSTLRNNRMAAVLTFYTDVNNVMHNYSRFTKCQFLTTSATLNDPTVQFMAFVGLYGVEGIFFMGNNFENTRTVQSVLDIPGNGMGIYSFGSGFQVLPVCANLACTQVQRNTFKNLAYGVQSWLSSTINTFKIDQADFIGNYRGILTNFVNYGVITNNKFEVLEYPSQFTPGGSYGIYLNNSTAYQVEANEFGYSQVFPNSTVRDGTYGIVVSNSGQYSNLIYRNTFHEIYIGTQAQRTNCHTQTNNPNDPPNDYGLQFKCNTFDYQAIEGYDIVVPNGCIDYHQGYFNNGCGTCAANNMFSQSNWEFYMDPIVPAVNYTYPLPIAGYQPTLISTNVGVTNNNTNPDCPSLITDCINCHRVAIQSANSQIAQLTSEVDGGSTTTLMNAINSNMSGGNLKNLLLTSSPYLSDDVLIAYINRSGNSPGNLKLVLLANSPLRQPVLDAYSQIASTLPSGIRNEIEAVQNGVSPLDALYGQIAMNEFNKDMAIDGMIRTYLTDTTISNGLDSVQAVLKLYGTTIEHKCKLASAQVTAKNFTDASLTLDTIQTEMGGTLDNECKLLSILIRLEQSYNGYQSIKDPLYSSDSTEVFNISRDTTDRAYVAAQALIKAIFEVSFQEVIDPIPFNTARQMNAEATQSTPNEFDLYPNPSNGNFSINYVVEETDRVTYEIYSITGSLLKMENLPGGSQQKQISVGELATGTYLFRMMINGIPEYSERIIISE